MNEDGDVLWLEWDPEDNKYDLSLSVGGDHTPRNGRRRYYYKENVDPLNLSGKHVLALTGDAHNKRTVHVTVWYDKCADTACGFT